MPRKLKVFRTPTGFHDAYVAAPSRKAALAAWGAEVDLFARGAAEEVTEPELMQAPLAQPGEVIRLSRGDLSAQLEALPPRKKAAPPARAATVRARRRDQQRPPPGRDKIAAAEEALAAAFRRHEAEMHGLEAEREAISRRIAALRSKNDKEIARLQRTRDAAREAYRAALERWSR